MSGRVSDAKDKGSGGLSVTTLVIASLSSLAAAIFIHEFWQGGAILGAAITPIIVSIVSELLRKPTDRVTAVVAQRAPVRGRASSASAPAPAPVGVAPEERDDPFGLREADRGRRTRRVRRRNLGLAFATGLAAFALAGFLLTGTELVIGNPLGGSSSSGSSGSGGGTTIFGGSSRSDDRDEQEPQEDPQREQAPAPDEEATPTQPAPETTPETTPETPAPETPAPEGTTPPGETPPAPQPTPPAPDATTPDPGGGAGPGGAGGAGSRGTRGGGGAGGRRAGGGG